MLDWLRGDPYNIPCGASARARRRLVRRVARDFLRERPGWIGTNVERPAEAALEALCAEAAPDARVGRDVLERVRSYYSGYYSDHTTT